MLLQDIYIAEDLNVPQYDSPGLIPVFLGFFA